ncbi:cytochrome c oxidase cbb3-type subunit 3 [Rhizobium sp. NFR03]|nr:cytochrome c oxidase cbb3-type subunit 3 [Rhizobium sp. NFR03]
MGSSGGRRRSGWSVASGTLSLCGVTLCCLACATALGWMRAPRQFRTDPPLQADLGNLRLLPNRIGGTPPESYFALGKPYEKVAYDLSQGKRLYTWFGCATCHGDGRGNIGPSFLDGWWLYGPEMISVAASIRDGRPHGMPAYRDRMTNDQIWQLAGYVRTIGAYGPSVSATARNDDPQTRPAENRGPASILFEQGPAGMKPEQGPSP